MLESILKAVKKNGIEEYRIIRRKTENAEFYFIKKELDMRRMKSLCTYKVTVYRDFEKDGEKMRGMADIQISPEMDEETIEKKLADAYYAASFVCNPYFELPKGKKEEPHIMSGRLPGMPLEETANAFARAIYAADTREDSFVNPAEIFVNK